MRNHHGATIGWPAGGVKPGDGRRLWVSVARHSGGRPAQGQQWLTKRHGIRLIPEWKEGRDERAYYEESIAQATQGDAGQGQAFFDKDAHEGESLGAEFWARARIETPKKPRSVHLKLDPEVFDFFVAETVGKGHLTRMQAVLKAYADARRSA
jgi:uncharacterized protein (DUF4415 family)